MNKDDTIDAMISTSENILLCNQNDVSAFMRNARDYDFIALDTEFLRISTYYPRLCLIQLASPDGANALIDPLNLEPQYLQSELASFQGVFVLHSASQDVEVLDGSLNLKIQKLFDTQVAFAMLGENDQLGYSTLVEKLLGISLEKAFTRTDWCQRPLSTGQLDYAINDVNYLCELHNKLSDSLTAAGKLSWALEEFENRINHVYHPVQDALFKKFRGLGDFSAVQQNRLYQLVLWREAIAKQKNRPREWIIKNKDLILIAKSEVCSYSEILQLDIEHQTKQRYARKIEVFVENNREKILSSNKIWEITKPLSDAERKTLKLLKSKLQSIAQKFQISASVIANSKDLEAIIRGNPGRLLEGWRSEVCASLI